MVNTKESEARLAEARVKGFEKFMEDPTTKLTLSLLPTGDHPDAVQTLVKSAFEAGHSNGQGTMLVEMLLTMFKKEPN